MDQRIQAKAYQDKMAKQRDRQAKARAAAKVTVPGIPAEPSISPADSISNVPSASSSKLSALNARQGKMEENFNKFMPFMDNMSNPTSPLVNAVVSQLTSVCRSMNVTVQPGDGSRHPGSPATHSGLTVSRGAVLEGHQAEQGMDVPSGDTLSLDCSVSSVASSCVTATSSGATGSSASSGECSDVSKSRWKRQPADALKSVALVKVILILRPFVSSRV